MDGTLALSNLGMGDSIKRSYLTPTKNEQAGTRYIEGKGLLYNVSRSVNTGTRSMSATEYLQRWHSAAINTLNSHAVRSSREKQSNTSLLCTFAFCVKQEQPSAFTVASIWRLRIHWGSQWPRGLRHFGPMIIRGPELVSTSRITTGKYLCRVFTYFSLFLLFAFGR
jgi:hypothetical protein